MTSKEALNELYKETNKSLFCISCKEQIKEDLDVTAILKFANIKREINGISIHFSSCEEYDDFYKKLEIMREHRLQ